jgi:soluble lytic murein transglycosylase
VRKLRRIILLLLGLALLLGFWRWKAWRDHRYDTEILTASRRYGLHPALVKAVIWRESRFETSARGNAGELGLMQIRNPAAQEWAAAERVKGFEFETLSHPATNTIIGSWYLAKLLKRYSATDRPLAYALADYNAGRGNVLRWIKGPAATNSVAFMEQMTFPGTRKYIEDISAQFEEYRATEFR